jgi:hypothetical protein
MGKKLLVLGFSLGYCKSESGKIYPGKANEKIADIIYGFRPDIICVQREIGAVLRSKFRITPDYEIKNVGGKQLSTKEISKQMNDFIRANNLQNEHILVVAHQYQMSNILRLLWMTHDLIVLPVYAKIPFDKNSYQAWARWPFLLKIREILIN